VVEGLHARQWPLAVRRCTPRDIIGLMTVILGFIGSLLRYLPFPSAPSKVTPWALKHRIERLLEAVERKLLENPPEERRDKWLRMYLELQAQQEKGQGESRTLTISG
jgi:hypothetical protein